jgi:NADH:ubiquinone oxidoreductase subunit 6 (subunit J)
MGAVSDRRPRCSSSSPGWDDALLWLLAAVMLGRGLLVVTMRDIIRCGLAMIVCFLALAGIYVCSGAPWSRPPRSSSTSARISVLILFAIMLTPDEGTRRTRLVFQTQAGPASIAAIVVAI